MNMTAYLRIPLRVVPLLLAALAQPVAAQVLLQENFNFTGPLTSNGWLVSSGGGTNPIQAVAPGLTYPNLPSSGLGNAAAVGPTGEDDRKVFSVASTTGDVYASCLINVSVAQAAGDYFYALSSGQSGFIGRVFAKSSGAGFVLGVVKSSGTTPTPVPTYDTTVLNFNTTYLVVLRIKRNAATTTDDEASIWINPVLGGAETAPAVSNNQGNDQAVIDSVVLRQGSSSNAPTVKVGNILVATTWAAVTPLANSPNISPAGGLVPFSTFAGTASAAQNFSVSASNLTASITVTAPTGIEVSSDNSVFAPTATLPTTGGTIYARVAASAAPGEISSSITLASPGATDASVALSASVRPTSIALPYGPDTFDTTSFPWYSYTVAGTKSWTRSSAGGNFFMEINGYNAVAGAAAANAWLILGPFDFPAGASNVVAQFNIQRAFNDLGSDAEFTFKVSTDYTGSGDPSSATWTDIPFPKPAAVTGTSTVFSPSGALPLPSSLAGQSGVFVAFQLQAADPIATSRWRMDDFEIFSSALPVISLLVNPAMIDEGSTAVGTVSLPSVPGADVNVTVTSADASLVRIEGGASAVLTIPANTDPPVATFGVSTTRDWVVGPDRQVQVTADAGASYEFGQALVTLKNIDVPATAFTSGGYTQDFAAFTSQATLPEGWSLIATTQTYSAWGDTSTAAGAKFSASPVNVFGYQHTSSTGVVQQVLTLRNDTGATITDVVVSYRGRMARAAETRYPAYSVVVGGYAVPALAYSTLDGDNVLRVANVSGLSVEPNQTFQVVWTSERGSNTGTSRQIGLGDLSVTLGTAALPPSVRNLSVPPSAITRNSAVAGADVVSDQGQAITARGFVYAPTSVNPDPVLGGQGVVDVPDAFAEIGPMNATLSGLDPGTSYTVKAYASNASGTSYTAPAGFTTLSVPIAFGGTYAEAFNNFTSATSPLLSVGAVKTGWTAISSGGVQSYGGSWDSGSSTGGFYGGASNPGALGYQPTTASPTVTVTSRLVNNTGATLTQLYVKYLGRVQLAGNARTPGWAVNVAGSAQPSLDYSTAAGADQTKSALVTGLNIANGAEFEITWTSDQGSVATGSFRRLGLANVIVSTSPIPEPAISVSGGVLPFSTTAGTASVSQFFSAGGTGISGDITVTAPAGFEVSLNNATFSSAVNLPSTNGTVATATVYVRLAATAAAGSPAGNVTVTSSGAVTQSLAVSGTVTPAGTTFAAWAQGAPLNSANLLRYAIGGASSPTSTDGIPMSYAVGPGGISITAIVRTNDPSLTVVGQAVVELASGTWSTNNVTMTPGDQTGVGEGLQRQIWSTPRGIDSRKFLRLQTTLGTP